ncbi:polyketide synthase [Ralstonia sp. 25C]|uniref:polyketide synthase n=1 Tax=Ralstonia sp. 25C TaxID=3447363 RepID=UPI003F752597
MNAAARTGTALAITGMACRYPHADGIEALWRCMQGPQAPMASHRLGPSSADPGAFGIPPIYRHSINDVQLDLLALSRDALAQAGLDADAIDRERTDVIFCHALGMNRQYENYARIAAVAWAEPVWANAGDGANAERARAAWKRKLDALFRATSHDKVGEMASTMPARVASHFRLRGRALALEAQERSAIEGLLAAWDAIATGRAQTVLLLGAQSLASPSLEALLRERLPAPLADALCEGACALVLQDADLAGTRAIACIDAIDVDDNVGGGPQAPVRVQVLDGVDAVAVTGEAAADVVVQAHQACGYGYAVQPLTALLQAALIQQRGGPSCTPPVAPDGLSVTVQGAATDGNPYWIALRSAHVTNVAHETKRPYDDAMPAPVAVVAMGARFGDGQDMADYLEALRSPTHRFRPLPATRPGHAAYYSADPQAPLSYYIDQASYCEPAEPSRAQAFDLACAAGGEAIARLPQGLAGEAGPVLVVTASNLTPAPLRHVAVRHELPRIEAALAALAREFGMDEAAAVATLREQAHREQSATAAWDALSASGISRALAGMLQAPARCVAVEAACAGSLAALDLAVNSLRSGRCRIAVVAGVETPVNTADLVLCASQRMLATGLIASFTEAATGFTPGDGAGVLVLCADEDAARWGLPALALIRASASCTQSKSMVAPNADGQVKSMRRAFEQVEFGPDAVDFVETHGTGTLIGDEVEISSLAQVYGPRTRPLRLGALKSRFGHCFAAAGIAGVIKTVLALRAESMPANYFGAPVKAGLRLAEHGFDPLAQAADWPAGPATRRAAVNAFGTGGVNYHVLLEESRT